MCTNGSFTKGLIMIINNFKKQNHRLKLQQEVSEHNNSGVEEIGIKFAQVIEIQLVKLNFSRVIIHSVPKNNMPPCVKYELHVTLCS